MMVKAKNILIAALLLVGFGCEEFLDVNVDDDQPSKSTPNHLVNPITGLMAINCYEQGETTAYFTQQIATLSGFSAVKDRWDYRSVTRVGLFRRHFHDVASNARNLILTAQEEESENYEGIGHTMMVLTTQTATDLFGDMPYEMALRGNPSPPYDEQQVIYEGMLAEIDQAIELLTIRDESDRAIRPEEDYLYGGDLDAWLGLAYGIKARLLLHLTPNINQNYQAVLDAVAAAQATWQDPEYQYIESPSPWFMNPWGPSRARPDWDYVPNILGTSAPTPYLVDVVMGYDRENDSIRDPRQPLLMTPNPDHGYLVVRTSEGKEALAENEDYPNLFGSYMTRDDSPQYFMTEEELHFIKAEAAFQSGDKATALAAYQAGIRRHMARVGVEQAAIDAFMAGALVAQDAASLELSHIMMQKWLALYLQAEAWVDMRRYKYDPKIYLGLTRPENLAAFWSEDDDTEWIQRLAYDNQTEEIYNKPELERLGAYQNPDWLKVPLWWTGQ